MGNVESGRCCIEGCEEYSPAVIRTEYKIFDCNSCFSCKQSSRRYICFKHNNNDYVFGLCYICPNAKATVINYYTHKMFHEPNVYKIRNSYVLFDFYSQGTGFYHRFDPVFLNIYKQTVSVHRDILYDLSIYALLDELGKNNYLYLGIVPKDIIFIIKKYL